MTMLAPIKEIANSLERIYPGCILESSEKDITVKKESLFQVASYLKNTAGLEFNYLNFITAVDYPGYFMLVYNLVSLTNNLNITFKTRCDDKANPSVPSVVSLWKGADLQEREIYDLMGIGFENHPNLKRIVLWDGFEGHPLRKDFKL